MKQLIQSYKTGELGLFDVPPPICEENGVLIRTTASLVSAGTEKMIVDIAKKSLLGKARARPDLVRQVMNKMKQEGVKNTLSKVLNKLDTPIPLGYSCAGRVVEVGKRVSGVALGDPVACGGSGYANHSSINYVPQNLMVKIPENVEDVDASFVTIGAIALQGVRQTEPSLGELIAVIGLGLIGQLTVQLLKANGCRVLGVDIDEEKLELAKKLGADAVCNSNEIISVAANFTNGYGVDGVIITASTTGNQPIIDAGEITRLKGRVVVVGLVGMDIPRNIYYKKELDVRLSMAYGPGRYDPNYEEKGIDYPYSYVRWTEQRNFQAFLTLVSDGKVTPSKLITHTFDFADALKAYDLLEGKVKEQYLGIVLTYKGQIDLQQENTIRISEKLIKSERVNIGLIGAGNFAKAVLLPTLRKIEGFELVGLCTATGVSAHATGKKYGFKYITTNTAEIFNNQEINTVVITTRHNKHAEHVISALKAGKHVFVEKPLCITPQELDEIAVIYSEMHSSQSSMPLLMVGFNRRFSPLIQRMKEVVKDKPVSITYRINAGIIPKDFWIQDMEVGGGRIIGEICHFVDTCTFLTGSYPDTIFATCVKKDDTSIPDEDNVNITITYANGSTAVINYLAYGNKQLPKEYIELFANDIAMQMNDFRELIIHNKNTKEKIKNSNQDKGFENELCTLQSAIKNGKPPIEFESIYKTTRTTFKIIESIKSKKVLPVD